MTTTPQRLQQLIDLGASLAPIAIELFFYRTAREIGSLAAATGGLDSLVFIAGIGEHAPQIRARICAQSAWLGIRLDPASNDAGGPRISTPDSPVSVWVIPTNEELMVARHTFTLASPSWTPSRPAK